MIFNIFNIIIFNLFIMLLVYPLSGGGGGGGGGGGKALRTFVDKGEGSKMAENVRTSFMDDPLQ